MLKFISCLRRKNIILPDIILKDAFLSFLKLNSKITLSFLGTGDILKLLSKMYHTSSSTDEFYFNGNQIYVELMSFVFLTWLGYPSRCHHYKYITFLQPLPANPLLNSLKCLSGRSTYDTSKTATVLLLCFKKLLMLQHPFKILRECKYILDFPRGQWRKSAHTSCSARILHSCKKC